MNEIIFEGQGTRAAQYLCLCTLHWSEGRPPDTIMTLANTKEEAVQFAEIRAGSSRITNITVYSHLFNICMTPVKTTFDGTVIP